MADEEVLVGRWFVRENEVVADEVCQRINYLVSTRLRRVAVREGGWTVLYEDPADKSYWELTYPHSEMHGGGPPKLAKLSIDDARRAYPDLA